MALGEKSGGGLSSLLALTSLRCAPQQFLPKLTLCALSDGAGWMIESRCRKISDLGGERGEGQLNESRVKG